MCCLGEFVYDGEYDSVIFRYWQSGYLITMWDKGRTGVGSGWRSPVGGWMQLLFQTHVGQAAINSLKSLFKDGQVCLSK